MIRFLQQSKINIKDYTDNKQRNMTGSERHQLARNAGLQDHYRGINRSNFL